ncbi:GNAT family N-acetyltransferase [Nonomuraea sp. NPDC050404]|uniref:GNAT family N-acetyltransferase n=1 Tax=Nonomuraea sp. NPDC050404 TaxID=3155783 RepID=UPI0033F39EEB
MGVQEFAPGLRKAWADAGRQGEPRLVASVMYALGPNARQSLTDAIAPYYAFAGESVRWFDGRLNPLWRRGAPDSLPAMISLARHRLTPAETGPALRALCAWTPADSPGGGLHPGDVGWYLRFEDAAVHLWTHDGTPVAAGFLDGPVLRVTAAPGADLGAIAADAEELLVPGNDWSDGLPVPGWEIEPDKPWLVLSWTPRPAPSRAEPVDEAGAADWATVQRSAFEGSTFSVERWHTMKRSPAGGMAVGVLVRTPEGEPAANAAGWFAGVGRCGLLEPVGTHPDHRGRGYGRDAVLGACAALVRRGASAVAVVTPAANEAAVALYRSAGFTVVRENRDWARPA